MQILIYWSVEVLCTLLARFSYLQVQVASGLIVIVVAVTLIDYIRITWCVQEISSTHLLRYIFSDIICLMLIIFCIKILKQEL